MTTSARASFLISWAQTELDGLGGGLAPREALAIGSTWRWTGDAVTIAPTLSPLVLGNARSAQEDRRLAAQSARRLVRCALGTSTRLAPLSPDDRVDADEDSFVVTDGVQIYAMNILEVVETGARLLLALDGMPPPDTDLWVLQVHLGEDAFVPRQVEQQPGVICFAPGTQIATPEGLRLIEQLRPGATILTKDNGPQEILWTGQRQMTGARLYAMPQLRPIRFRQGALGQDRPGADLWVSPQHRMLVKGQAAQSLFGTEEVLVAAEHLLNGHSIMVDHGLREVTYIHMLLERHNVIWANGLETESFHPAQTDLGTVEASQREALFSVLPDLAGDPGSYGGDARRSLSASEAAILRHEHAA